MWALRGKFCALRNSVRRLSQSPARFHAGNLLVIAFGMRHHLPVSGWAETAAFNVSAIDYRRPQSICMTAAISGVGASLNAQSKPAAQGHFTALQTRTTGPLSMLATVTCESSLAVAMPRRSPSASVTLALLIATSVPEPKALDLASAADRSDPTSLMATKPGRSRAGP